MPTSHREIEVSFLSEGQSCCGRFLLPSEPVEPLPCVVLPTASQGQWTVPEFASRFADAGIAVFIFNYRHLGKSAGTPRQIVDIQEQRTDLRNAIAFARRRQDIDTSKVALWGTSLGGSHVIVIAAEDSSIAAVVANMPALDAFRGTNLATKMRKQRATTGQLVLSTVRLLAAAVIDRCRGLLGLSPHYLAVYGKMGRAFFTDPALADRFETVQKRSPTWKNKVAARFLLQPPRYEPGTVARIVAPVLFSLATRDVEVSSNFIREVAKESPRTQVQEYSAEHFDLYHGELLEQVASDQKSFLLEHLRGLCEDIGAFSSGDPRDS